MGGGGYSGGKHVTCPADCSERRLGGVRRRIQNYSRASSSHLDSHEGRGDKGEAGKPGLGVTNRLDKEGWGDARAGSRGDFYSCPREEEWKP